MEALQVWVARIAGVVGVLLSVIAVIARLAGQYWLGGVQTGTLLQAGVAAMVAACLSYLALLAERSRAGR